MKVQSYNNQQTFGDKLVVVGSGRAIRKIDKQLYGAFWDSVPGCADNGYKNLYQTLKVKINLFRSKFLVATGEDSRKLIQDQTLEHNTIWDTGNTVVEMDKFNENAEGVKVINAREALKEMKKGIFDYTPVLYKEA